MVMQLFYTNIKFKNYYIMEILYRKRDFLNQLKRLEFRIIGLQCITVFVMISKLIYDVYANTIGRVLLSELSRDGS